MKDYDVGSKRIKAKNFNEYIKSESQWKKLGVVSLDIQTVIDSYLNRGQVSFIKSKHDSNFLKGGLSPNGGLVGERVRFLPDGRELARAGFSLYAKNLVFNFGSDVLWDVCYENDSGLKTYLYSIDKVHLEEEKKYKLVKKFEENYELIMKNTIDGLKLIKDVNFLALYTLLKTLIRVGNLEYFNRFHHRGLTTLSKKNVSIKGDQVSFHFIGKDGIPQSIVKKFPKFYLSALKDRLDGLNDDDFIFANESGHPIPSFVFTRLMNEWTGEHFYPHIIRSHFADMECEDFLRFRRKATKDEIENKFLEIAEALGHRKYNKKEDCYEVCYTVTLANYIYPKLSERMLKLVE